MAEDIDIAYEEVNVVFEDTLKAGENCSDDVDKFPHTNKNDNDMCMTEVHTLNSSDFVSASCSSIDSHLPFLEKKTNVFSTKKPDHESASEDITRLYSPFVKIEDSERKYKPRYKVFSSWTEDIDSVLLQSVNKLAVKFKLFGNADFSRPPLKEIFIQPQSSSQQLKRTITQEVECSTSKSLRYNNSKTGGYNSSKVAGYNSISNPLLICGLVGKQTEKGPRKRKACEEVNGAFEEALKKEENFRKENVDTCPKSNEND